MLRDGRFQCWREGISECALDLGRRWVSVLVLLLASAQGLAADIDISLGDLEPGQRVTIVYDLLPPEAPLDTQLCNQGSVSGDNFSALVTDDPGLPGIADPSCSALGRLTVIKQVVGGPAAIGAFELRVGETVVEHGVERAFPSGTYQIGELGPPQYAASFSGACDSAGQVSITPGSSQVCTITNTYLANPVETAWVVLSKRVINDDGGDETTSDFLLSLGGTRVDSGQRVARIAGVPLEIGESGPPGYLLSRISGDPACPKSLPGYVTPRVGETIHCTLENDDVAPTVTLIKQIENDDGGSENDPDAFGLSIGGAPIQSGVSMSMTANTPLAVGEAGLAGYGFVDLRGLGCPDELGDSVTLEEGEQLTCTVVNSDLPAEDVPQLTLRKLILENTHPPASPSDFPLLVGGHTVPNGVAREVPANTPLRIDEIQQEGFQFVEIRGEGCPAQLGGEVQLAAKQRATCTIVNTRVPVIPALKARGSLLLTLLLSIGLGMIAALRARGTM